MQWENGMQRSNYDLISKIGMGTFGTVYRAVNRESKMEVAVKKLKMKDVKEGIQKPTLREIKFLHETDHPYIIKLLDVYSLKQNLFLVFPMAITDLEKVVLSYQRNQKTMPVSHIKCVMLMLLKGMQYLHSNYIIHRDLKPSNLLITAEGEVKITDFGSARNYGSPNKMTPTVVTMWYRAPELLFGSTSYATAVDVWSIGCIFAELILGRPFLPGNSEIDQLSLIFQSRGTPSPSSWPDAELLPNYLMFQPTKAPNLFDVFKVAPNDEAIDLLNRFLQLNPSQRITCDDALKHAYFKSSPAAADPSELLKPPQQHYIPPSSPFL